MGNARSLMDTYFTSDLQQLYQGTQTSQGWKIEDVVRSGVVNPDSNVGVYAGDEESYFKWNQLFEPIICAYHQVDRSSQHKSYWGNPCFSLLDPEEEYIKSTRIRVARNLKGVPFPAAQSMHERISLEQHISKTLKEQRYITGEYYSLAGLPEKVKIKLESLNSMMRPGDRFMDCVGFNNDWPVGRGIFFNPEMSLIIWIGEEDLFRVISMESGSNIESVYKRLQLACEVLDSLFNFAVSDDYGYFTSCPSNIGNAMRASVHIRLPNISKNESLLKQFCTDNDLQIRGTHGEHTAVEERTFDVSNSRRLGITEYDIVTNMVSGVQQLIKIDKEAINRSDWGG